LGRGITHGMMYAALGAFFVVRMLTRRNGWAATA
jgi:uncharacterized membrane protein